VALHRDRVGARTVELCGAVVDLMRRPGAAGLHQPGADGADPEAGLSVLFPRLLADAVRFRLDAFAGAGVLAQALALCRQLLRGATGAAARAALELALRLLLSPFAPAPGEVAVPADAFAE
jgi:hypothetical protein